MSRKGADGFRKLDVDAISDDEESNDAVKAVEDIDESQITGLLSQNKQVEALKLLIKNARQCKNSQVTLRVLASFKTAEMGPFVQGLDSTDLSTLLNYIYKGFENPQEGSSATLLAWHDKVFSAGGEGSIVRTLTQR